MIRTWWLGLGVAVSLLALTGCEVSVGNCDKDDGGSCIDDFPIFDGGGAGMDATTDGSATPNDGGSSLDPDGGGLDGAVTGPALTVAQFCRAQLETAVKWRDLLLDSESCACARQSDDVQAKIRAFLAASLAYAGEDPEGACITRLSDAINAGRIQYVGTNAAACASKFAMQFGDPPAMCPVDLAAQEAQLAHGAQQLVQIGECRSAFAGKVARDGTCSDSLDCQIGLRCLPITGSMTMTTCQPARGAQESCERSVECSDGFVCAGEGFSDPTPPRVCIPANLLRANNGACSFSFECIKDLVCRSEKCTTPTADAICTPS